MCITFTKSTANLKPIDNLVVSPKTPTVSGELCWLTGLQNQEADGLQQRLIICLLSATERSVSNVARRISIRTYKVKTSNKTLPSFVSRNSWHPLAEPRGSTEPDLRTADTDNSRYFIERGKEGRGSEIEGSIRILKNVSAVTSSDRCGKRRQKHAIWRPDERLASLTPRSCQDGVYCVLSEPTAPAAPHRPLPLSGRVAITEDRVLRFGTQWWGCDVIYLATSTVNLPTACFFFVQTCLLTFAVFKMLSVLTFGCLVSRHHPSTVRCS